MKITKRAYFSGGDDFSRKKIVAAATVTKQSSEQTQTITSGLPIANLAAQNVAVDELAQNDDLVARRKQKEQGAVAEQIVQAVKAGLFDENDRTKVKRMIEPLITLEDAEDKNFAIESLLVMVEVMIIKEYRSVPAAVSLLLPAIKMYNIPDFVKAQRRYAVSPDREQGDRIKIAAQQVVELLRAGQRKAAIEIVQLLLRQPRGIVVTEYPAVAAMTIVDAFGSRVLNGDINENALVIRDAIEEYNLHGTIRGSVIYSVATIQDLIAHGYDLQAQTANLKARGKLSDDEKLFMDWAMHLQQQWYADRVLVVGASASLAELKLRERLPGKFIAVILFAGEKFKGERTPAAEKYVKDAAKDIFGLDDTEVKALAKWFFDKNLVVDVIAKAAKDKALQEEKDQNRADAIQALGMVRWRIVAQDLAKREGIELKEAQDKLADAIWQAHYKIPYVSRKDNVQAWRRMVRDKHEMIDKLLGEGVLINADIGKLMTAMVLGRNDDVVHRGITDQEAMPVGLRAMPAPEMITVTRELAAQIPLPEEVKLPPDTEVEFGPGGVDQALAERKDLTNVLVSAGSTISGLALALDSSSYKSSKGLRPLVPAGSQGVEVDQNIVQLEEAAREEQVLFASVKSSDGMPDGLGHAALGGADMIGGLTVILGLMAIRTGLRNLLKRIAGVTPSLDLEEARAKIREEESKAEESLSLATQGFKVVLKGRADEIPQNDDLAIRMAQAVLPVDEARFVDLAGANSAERQERQELVLRARRALVNAQDNEVRSSKRQRFTFNDLITVWDMHKVNDPVNPRIVGQFDPATGHFTKHKDPAKQFTPALLKRKIQIGLKRFGTVLCREIIACGAAGLRDEASVVSAVTGRRVDLSSGTFVDWQGNRENLDTRVTGLPERMKELLTRYGVGVKSVPVVDWDEIENLKRRKMGFVLEADGAADMEAGVVHARAELRFFSGERVNYYDRLVSHELGHILDKKIGLMELLASMDNETIQEIMQLAFSGSAFGGDGNSHDYDFDRLRAGFKGGDRNGITGEATAEALGKVMLNPEAYKISHPKAYDFFNKHVGLGLDSAPAVSGQVDAHKGGLYSEQLKERYAFLSKVLAGDVPSVKPFDAVRQDDILEAINGFDSATGDDDVLLLTNLILSKVDNYSWSYDPAPEVAKFAAAILARPVLANRLAQIAVDVSKSDKERDRCLRILSLSPQLAQCLGSKVKTDGVLQAGILNAYLHNRMQSIIFQQCLDVDRAANRYTPPADVVDAGVKINLRIAHMYSGVGAYNDYRERAVKQTVQDVLDFFTACGVSRDGDWVKIALDRKLWAIDDSGRITSRINLDGHTYRGSRVHDNPIAKAVTRNPIEAIQYSRDGGEIATSQGAAGAFAIHAFDYNAILARVRDGTIKKVNSDTGVPFSTLFFGLGGLSEEQVHRDTIEVTGLSDMEIVEEMIRHQTPGEAQKGGLDFAKVKDKKTTVAQGGVKFGADDALAFLQSPDFVGIALKVESVSLK
jgi:hypothetical protein